MTDRFREHLAFPFVGRVGLSDPGDNFLLLVLRTLLENFFSQLEVGASKAVTKYFQGFSTLYTAHISTPFLHGWIIFHHMDRSRSIYPFYGYGHLMDIAFPF